MYKVPPIAPGTLNARNPVIIQRRRRDFNSAGEYLRGSVLGRLSDFPASGWAEPPGRLGNFGKFWKILENVGKFWKILENLQKIS